VKPDNKLKNSYPSFAIIVVFILLVVCGIPLIHYLNIKLNPDASSSSLTVSFSWTDAEPEAIEQEATSKLEGLFARVNGIKNISSTSGNGSGKIDLTLDKNANADAIRLEISTLIRQVWPELPDGVTYPSINVNSTDGENRRPLLSFMLISSQDPPVVMQYADDYIRPVLSQIKGINKIDISGAAPLEWIIEYDNEKIRSAGITPNDIRKAVITGLGKENIGIGLVRSSGRAERISSMPVTLRTFFTDGKEILNIPVKKSGGRIVFLADIAALKHVEGQPSSFYRINGLNTINIVVYAGPGENSLVVGKKTKETMSRLSSLLPPGYELLSGDDSTEYINHELHNIGLRSLCTVLILLIFIFLITRKIKHALLIIMMLAGNLAIAVIFYYLFRLEIHLYALAGITVSLGLMTDNIIIMSDHLRTRGNRKAFLAILAGTLATVSALVVIFFLKDQVKANLVDFALVIIINQSVSLLTALFVIPAMMDKMKLDKQHIQPLPSEERKKNTGRERRGLQGRRRFIVRFTNTYRNVYLFLRKNKAIAVVVFILAFGLPLYMLPEKWEGEKWYNKAYNNTLGASWYKTNLKPWVGKLTGGALRLFTEKVYSGSYFRNPEETALFITATMPRGTTLSQADVIVSGLEDYLKQFSQLKLFQTSIYPRNASINVYFREQYQRTGFPYILRGEIIEKAVDLGGAEWSVFGIGDAFSNTIYESAGRNSIRMLGYNYDRLIELAGILKDSLAQNPRIKQVYILPEPTWYKPDNTEFVAQIDNEHAASAGLASSGLYSSLQSWSLYQPAFAGMVTGRGLENIRLKPREASGKDVWTLSRQPVYNDSVMYKLSVLSAIGKETTAPVISKINQQYRVYLQFDYVGADKYARKYIDEKISNFTPLVPVGYYVSARNTGIYWWGQQDKKQYWLLLLIVVMIFFICSVLFESLLQPFAVILTIPVAYIGIFLTFYIFGLNFDQGGFAALVMLTGITVNAAIYILNDFNHLRRQQSGRNMSELKLYFKAFNYKIIPVFISVVSTVLGFVPFLIGERQPFWFALAAGTIGGLLFSLLGIVFYLPLFLRIKERSNEGMKE
jgi:multidrug efflux pump subunit AcrB